MKLISGIFRDFAVLACICSASLCGAQTPFVQSDLNVHVASLRDAPPEERTAVFVVHTNSKIPPVEGPFFALVKHKKPLEALALSDITGENSISGFVGHNNGTVNLLSIGGVNYRVRGPAKIMANFHGAEAEIAWAPVAGGSASYLTIFQNNGILLFIGSKLIANISGVPAKELRADISRGKLTVYSLGENGRLSAGGYAMPESTPVGIINADGGVLPCADKKFKVFVSKTEENGEVKKTPLEQESLLFLTSHQDQGVCVVGLHFNDEQKPDVYRIRQTGNDECSAELVR